MSQFNLQKPRRYIAEILNREDDRLTVITPFKPAVAMHDWAIAYLHNHPEVWRIQIWRDGTDVDNPDVNMDWVSVYSKEPFREFGQESIPINRTTKNTRGTIGGHKETIVFQLPTVYCVVGNWSKASNRKGKNKKKTEKRKINLEALEAS